MSEIELKKHDKPLGASGTDVVSRIHNADDHIESLQGYQAAEYYDRMRRSDTQVKKVLAAINNPIRSAEWSIQPTSDDKKDLDAAAIIEQILFKDINWSKFINEALTSVAHGYSMFEVVHQNKDNKDLGAYTGLAQLGFRRQSTITEWFHNSITGELEKVKQECNTDIEINTFIPREFLLLFFSEQEGDNIGFPLLRVMYGPYKRKLLATELQYIGIERFAIPTPILKVPKNINQGDAEYIAAVDVLKNFTSAEDSYITYPDGWELDLHNNIFDPDKLKAVIKSEDEAMSGAILAAFLELGTGGNGGAFALGSDMSDFFLAGIEYYANIIVDTINNELIPNLIALNFGEELSVLPKLSYSGVSDKAGKELMEVVTGYTGSGVIHSDEPLEDYIRKVHKLPPKAEGTMVDNGESEGDVTNEEEEEEIVINKDDELDSEVSLKLSELVGHTHKLNGVLLGPAVLRGQKHFHQLLDSEGNVTGQTKTEQDTAGHKHEYEDQLTSKKINTKLEAEEKENPKKLIEKSSDKVTNIIRFNLEDIADKYIADILSNYKKLSDKNKLNATKDVKLGGVAKFKKELKSSFTNTANKADQQVRAEVPTKADVKLKSDVDAMRLEFSDYDTFKFNDFSKLPKRIQILIANQALLLSDKESQSVADTIAFQFNSSEATTNDINVIKKDLEDAADKAIQSGSRELAAANVSSSIVNETRNTFLLSEEVAKDIYSYTFINFDPKTDICKAMAGTTYSTNDPDLARYQPPLHHNCKSYIRANIKTSASQPDVTGLPPISDSAKSSITLSEEK